MEQKHPITAIPILLQYLLLGSELPRQQATKLNYKDYQNRTKNMSLIFELHVHNTV